MTHASENAERSTTHLRQLISETNITRPERMKQFDQLDEQMGEISDQIRRITKAVMKPDASGITRTFKNDEIQILTDNLSELSLMERKLADEERILSSLNFDQRPVRHDAITVASAQTFEWILSRDASGHDTDPHSFIRWLESGEGIYWVSGKPGSGKSTLMKFIIGHPHTTTYLSTWSGSTHMVLASHFFWSAGSPIQRSREGLLRTLLYDILAQIPGLIPTVCNKRWAEVESRRLIRTSWSLEELQTSLRMLAAQKTFPVRFCFFIDGLDEFAGDSFDICQTLVDLCTSKYIKMCISSRPWDVFESYLGNTPEKKMYIHDLTKGDIRSYVKSELRIYSSSLNSVSAAEDDRLAALINEITNRAQGVFLWVFLVTRLLREGFKNNDSLADLQGKLDSIPTDLELFFKLILESVEPVYREKQAGTLQVALIARGSLRSEIYSFCDLEYVKESYALDHAVRILNKDEHSRLYGSLPKRLNARCKGLLEIRNGSVEFLHRTVRDFLRTGEMTAFLSHRTKPNFNANMSILRAHIAWLKSSQFAGNYRCVGQEGSLSFISRLGQMLDYAHAADMQDEQCQKLTHKLLDDLEVSIQLMVLRRQILPARIDQENPDNSNMTTGVVALFRQALIEKDLAQYISTKISDDPFYFDEIETDPLVVALQTFVVRNDTCPSLFGKDADEGSMISTGSIRTLQLLLQHGKNPNQLVKLRPSNMVVTPWSYLISLAAPWHLHETFDEPLDKEYEDRFIHSLTSGVFSMLLRHGADPNVKLPDWQPERIEVVLSTLNPYELDYLQKTDVNGIRRVFYVKNGSIRDGYRKKEFEYSIPTVPVVWIFLGLKCANLWQHADDYLRDLKVMIMTGADFSGLKSFDFFEERYYDTPIDTANTSDLVLSELALEKMKRREKWRIARQSSRWEILCQAIQADNDIGEQIFQAQIISQLKRADIHKTLPWQELEPIIEKAFPPSVRDIAFRGIHESKENS